jgi:RNA polymerase subunit RPABC4/transcription elongation factor Spt4
MECPECGQPVAPGAAECRVCGHRFAEAPAPAPKPVAKAPPSPKAAARTACPFCDAVVPEDAATCPSCGTSLRGALRPAAREAAVQRTRPELQVSSTYLVTEETSTNSYQLFLRTVAAGTKGFCVTRVYPEKIREQYGLPGVPILWLSNVGKEDTVRPKDLEKLSLSLEQFISREKGVVLIDGIEYLITNNNFITVLRLVQTLRDQVAMNNALLVFSVNPATLDEHQLHLLEREVDTVLDLRA